MILKARVALERQDVSRVHEVIARDISGDVKREDFIQMSEKSRALIDLIESFMANAFRMGVDFRDHNLSRFFDVTN